MLVNVSKIKKTIKHNIKSNIPNIITILGLIIVNYSLMMYSITSKTIYIIFMIIGCLCDYLDGYFARKLKTESNLGNFLDKIVDKINQSSILLTIYYKYKTPILYFYLYIIREIIMFLMRYLKLKSPKSSFYGKLKTFIFPLTILFYHFNIIGKKIFLNFMTIFNFITLLF